MNCIIKSCTFPVDLMWLKQALTPWYEGLIDRRDRPGYEEEHSESSIGKDQGYMKMTDELVF